MIALALQIFVVMPCRAYSGRDRMVPSFRRRDTIFQALCSPISCTTSTVGSSILPAGIGGA
jgi:hypothetical protein